VRVIELGFGNGAFAASASAAGARYLGAEAIPDLVQIGRDAGFDVALQARRRRRLADSTAADLVVAFDVCEHLEPGVLSDSYACLNRQHWDTPDRDYVKEGSPRKQGHVYLSTADPGFSKN
jgi:hypothetical protein